MYHNSKEKYYDKMRALSHPFDIICASNNYINEEIGI